MTDKPKFHILLQISAMVFAAILSYGILKYNAPEPAGLPVADMTTSAPADRVTLPEAVFYNAAGHPVQLSDFKGKVLLVNLWATWCPPCVVELPALDSLQAKLGDRNFMVVAISLDRTSIEAVAGFLSDRKIENMDIYWDKDRQIPQKWQYKGIPVSFLIDKEGRLVETFEGPRDWTKGDLFDTISAQID